jgi:hypothetical protein
VATARGANRIDVADDVSHCHVRSCELLHEATVAIDPGDGGSITAFVEKISRVFGDWSERVVVDLTSSDDRNDVIEERCESAKYARLGLPSKTEKYEVVPREKGIDDLRHDSVFVAEDTFKEGSAALEAGQEIVAELILHRAESALG